MTSRSAGHHDLPKNGSCHVISEEFLGTGCSPKLPFLATRCPLQTLCNEVIVKHLCATSSLRILGSRTQSGPIKVRAGYCQPFLAGTKAECINGKSKCSNGNKTRIQKCVAIATPIGIGSTNGSTNATCRHPAAELSSRPCLTVTPTANHKPQIANRKSQIAK